MPQSQNVSAASSPANDPIFQLLVVQIKAFLSSSQCMGPMFTIEHGVPKEVAEVMLEQIIQEFAAGCESLTKKLARDKIQNKVEEFKKCAAAVIPLLPGH